jgi:hypothetical protein
MGYVPQSSMEYAAGRKSGDQTLGSGHCLGLLHLSGMCVRVCVRVCVYLALQGWALMVSPVDFLANYLSEA